MSPTSCLSCQTAMRPGETLLADAPGTVKHGGRGLCSTCYGKPWIREQYDVIKRPGADLLAEAALLLDRRAVHDVAPALGVTPAAIARAARRHHRPELARPFEHLIQRQRTARLQARRREQRSAA